MQDEKTVFARLCESIGPDAALKLSAVYGGANIYVPPDISFAHPIVLAVGAEAAAKISETYGGKQLSVPALAEFSTLRAKAVCAVLSDAGLGPKDIGAVLTIDPQEARRLALAGQEFKPRLTLTGMLRQCRVFLATQAQTKKSDLKNAP